MKLLLSVSLLALSLPMAACTSVDLSPYRVRRPVAGPTAQQGVSTKATTLPATVVLPPRKESANPPLSVPPIRHPPISAPSSAPSPPAPVTSCDPGGCWSAGERYQGGTGNTYLNRDGRLCQSRDGWMQCY